MFFAQRKSPLSMVILLMAFFISPLSSQAENVWYVATSGHDAKGDGSSQRPFGSIQTAIDAACDGDVVIVMEGKYAGPGNVGLDFMGKAITVRSRDPKSDACMRATIIDGQGQGLLVRFVSGEGSESVFEGFTLLAGDISGGVRGAPGFFEFSQDARPTTRKLRIAGDGPARDIQEIVSVKAAPPYGGRAWEGINLFHQPVITTDYHGSGDVDKDGILTPTDASLAQEMASGSRSPSSRADVDGNGLVDGDDVLLINDALGGGHLPAWWNDLTAIEDRNFWVDRVMALERTDQHPYYQSWWVCYNFAVQLMIHGAYYRGDLFRTRYDGGPTVFNVPMCIVGITAPSFGHGINGILVGDDPLNFDHWRFLEPQSDEDVHPGDWDMPYNSDVKIRVVSEVSGTSFGYADRVSFHVDETGWSLLEHNPELILTRPVPEVSPPDNLPDLWDPRIVPVDPGFILFDCSRDDASHTTDIHLAELPFSDPPDRSPLVLSSEYSRLLDIYHGPDGTIHLLWRGKANHTPGVFHGELDPVSGEITSVTRVSTGVRMIRMARVIATPGGEVHVFWLERKTNADHPHETGIYWTRWMGSGWQAEENLAPYAGHLSDFCEYNSWDKRDFLQYYFDAVHMGNDDVLLVWAEPIGSSEALVQGRIYDGQWGSAAAIQQSNVRGVDLSTSSTRALHLISWLGSGTEGRGNLVHWVSSNGASWAGPETVDASGDACCPRMVPGADGVVYLVWEGKVAGQVVPKWNKYEGGTWHATRALSVRSGADAWYPTAEVLPDGRLVIAWSSRCPNRVTIEMSDSTETSIPVFSQSSAGGIPESFKLSQNYPNPFNPQTVIEYQLPKDAMVSLRVYNIMGQEVSALVAEEQKAGYCKALWDGTDKAGLPLASGVYFFCLQADAFRAIRKTVLLR